MEKKFENILIVACVIIVVFIGGRYILNNTVNRINRIYTERDNIAYVNVDIENEKLYVALAPTSWFEQMTTYEYTFDELNRSDVIDIDYNITEPVYQNKILYLPLQYRRDDYA